MSPLVIGHRGAASEAPENSLEALALAMELGADALELDVRRSSDGVLVVIHDSDLARTSRTRGRVDELPAARIREADLSDASDPLIPRWPETIRVPTLEEVFRHFPGVEITVDVKDPSAGADVVRLIEIFDRVPDTILYVESGTGSHAFRDYRGRRATSVSQAARLASDPSLLLAIPEREIPEVVHTPLRHDGLDLVGSAFVRAVHESGRTIQVWTVDDLPTMDWLADCGVDGIITNDVRAAAARVGAKAPREEPQ
jgi:glycerophosphoryl diester phosphodiesterase